LRGERYAKGVPRILIVEDDADIRESLTVALEWEGFEVFSAANGREGIEALAVLPAPCLILLDLMMPVMNGWEFAAALGTEPRLATIPIVVVSAFSERGEAIAAKAFLSKPIALDLLLDLAERYCGKGAAPGYSS
jgi:CheY-like chemotaxis protein